MRLEVVEAEVDMLNWLQVVVKATAKCLHEARGRTIAFSMRVGIGHQQSFLSTYVKQRTVADCVDYFAPGIPTKEELQQLTGSGVAAPRGFYWH